MLLEKIANEIELLSRVDAWLLKSIHHHPAPWESQEDEASHAEAVKKYHNLNIASRFPSGDVHAEALTGALSTELLRLVSGPAILRNALLKCSWSDEFGIEGHGLISALEHQGL